MIKKAMFCVLLATQIMAQPLVAFAAAPSWNVNAKAAVLMEPSSGIVLLEQNAHEALAPASVTKVMTMLLIYEAVDQGKIKWTDMVTVSDHAAGMGGSQVYLEPMEQQTVETLTKCIAVASANDGAVAMAEFIAGSEDGFVLMMNNKAKELDMKDTHFVNACGLDAPGHVTSAYDVALMARELTTRYPQVLTFSQIWMDTIVHKTARGESEFGLSNTNRLIKSYGSATGLKTGSTNGALFCIAATASRDGMDQIAVVLGAPDSNTRFHETIKMMDYGFANFSVTKGEDAGTVKGDIRLFKGNMETVPVAVKSQVTCLVPKGKTGTIEGTVEMLDFLNAPAPKGTKAGEVVYHFEGKEVGRSDLITCEDVEKATLPDILQRLGKGWFQ